jgi:ATP-dependent DNA ligase
MHHCAMRVAVRLRSEAQPCVVMHLHRRAISELRLVHTPLTYRRMLWRTPLRSRRTPSAGFIVPAQPILVSKPPSGPEWIHEVKHDGYRILARKEADRVTVWTRHGTDFTAGLPRIADAVRTLPIDRRRQSNLPLIRAL